MRSANSVMVPCEATKFKKAQDSAANKNAIDPKEQAGGGGDEEDGDDDADEPAAPKAKKTPKKTQRVQSSSSEAHLPEPCSERCLGFNISDCLHCELCRTCTPE